MFTLIFTKHADRIIQKMERDINHMIFRALQEIKEDPYRYVEGLKRPKGAEPLYKYYIGDFRAVMAIRNREMIILIIDIGHRRSVYRKWGG